MTPPLQIAIDGTSAAGKSTLSRRLANDHELTYVDTGAMYRMVALAAGIRGLDPHDPEAMGRLCGEIEIDFAPDGEGQRALLDGRDVTADIRRPAVSQGASIVSAHSPVRRAMQAKQRDVARGRRVIMEGRDIGTVILPAASLKIFLTATLAERARRRLADLRAAGTQTTLEAVEQDLAERDERDSNRKDSPLRRADDARLLDTTELGFEDVVQRVDHWIAELE